MTEMKMKNYMEDCIEDMLDSVVNELNCCKCDKCKYDIMAITLNSLKPKYVVTKKGEMYAKLGTLHHQFDVDIISAITTASAIVSKNPRHS